MSTIKVNKIENRTGTTLTAGAGACKTVVLDATTVTIGRCGGAVNLAPGASQTGFGRTGTVDWCSTAKTAPFTATSGDGFFVNTTGGAITVTLPSSPNAGDIVAFADYANTWATACKDVTVCRNGSKINGGCFNATLNTAGQSVTLIYVDGTRGWKNIQDSTSNVTGAPDFISATGGTITESGNFRIHTFTSTGIFNISTAPTPGNNNVDYLIIGGGGGAGVPNGGGGGAGGFREAHTDPVSGPYTASPLAISTPVPVSAQAYPITVGAGGTGNNSGTNSIFDSITSAGGGKGGPQGSTGTAGGSGGGAGRDSNTSGGAGNTPSVSPPQGQNGGSVSSSAYAGGGGGGGASAAGTNGGGGSSGGGEFSGGGGDGHGTEINPAAGVPGPSGPLRYFSGGGSGNNATGSPGAVNPSSSPSPGLTGKAGVGGGGQGYGASPPISNIPGNGTDNTGGGGGSANTGNGGSGVVIIRYKYQ